MILAQDHNPSILHPFFLSAQSIVPKDWEPAQPPICTPPLSMVSYKNGITITVESNKFQVAKSPPTPNMRESEVPRCASRYIETLPHVLYKAVGINFGAILEDSDPSRRLIDKFLAQGVWNSEDLLVKELSLRFVYSLEGGTLNLSCDPGSVTDNTSNRTIKGIVLGANYHFDLPGGNPAKEAVDTLKKFTNLSDRFEWVIKRIFETEE